MLISGINTGTEILKRNKLFAGAIGGGVLILAILCYATVSVITKPMSAISSGRPQAAQQLVQELMVTQKSIAPPSLSSLKHDKIIMLHNNPEPSNVKITDGWISSPYGYRAIFGRFHHGIDVAANIGTKIYAYDDGVVTYSGHRGTYGLMIELDHGNGTKTRYAHCNALYYKKGAIVSKGEHIADVGNTGRSTGPHLHFELRVNGKSVNPRNLF